MGKIRIGELLVQKNLVTPEQVEAALDHQKKFGIKVGKALVLLGAVKEKDLCLVLASHLKVPIIDITSIPSQDIKRSILELLDLETAEKYRVAPIALRNVSQREHLIIATSDPLNYKAIDEIHFRVGRPVLAMISPDSDIDWFIQKYYRQNLRRDKAEYISKVKMVQFEGEIRHDYASIYDDSLFMGVKLPKTKVYGGTGKD